MLSSCRSAHRCCLHCMLHDLFQAIAPTSIIPGTTVTRGSTLLIRCCTEMRTCDAQAEMLAAKSGVKLPTDFVAAAMASGLSETALLRYIDLQVPPSSGLHGCCHVVPVPSVQYALRVQRMKATRTVNCMLMLARLSVMWCAPICIHSTASDQPLVALCSEVWLARQGGS